MLCRSTWLVAASLLLFYQGSICLAQGKDDGAGDAELGRRLFVKQWHPENESHRIARSDQLGPLFNARSCAACHDQGGVGGAGDNSRNAHLLSILPQRKHRRFDLSDDALKRMFEQGKSVHQHLGETNTIVLHKFSVLDGYQQWKDSLLWPDANPDLAESRRQKLAGKPVHRVGPRVADGRRRDFTLQVTQRNTPSLFGTGLIETIPDEAILEIAEKQRKTKGKFAVRGKVAGKFGWRGQMSTLEEFTSGACATELGLKTPSSFPQELPDSMELPAGYKPGFADDIDREQLRDMVAFIRELPPPKEVKLHTFVHRERAQKGKAVFENLQCSTCHVRKVGDVDGVYSDFLLHDMGSALADVAGVVNKVTSITRHGGGGYSGSGGPVRTVKSTDFAVGNDRLWQTPPLWGLAKSAPYLHDGRAADLHDAIMMHAGEADESRRKYKKLPKKYKVYLREYLLTLGHVEHLDPFAGQAVVEPGEDPWRLIVESASSIEWIFKAAMPWS